MTSQNKKSLTLREQDPFLERERKKYRYPLPSREWIEDLLNKIGIPIHKRELAKKLSIQSNEYDYFENRLHAMVRDGQIYINRRGAVCIAEKLNLVQCRVQGHKDGYGFAIPLHDSKQADFVLSAKQMQIVMHDDLVSIRQKGVDKRGRPEGRIVEILERANTELVVRVFFERGLYIAIPEDKRILQSFLLTDIQTDSIDPGQIAVIKIDHYPDHLKPATAHIIEILGNYADAGLEIDIALRKHHLPHQFSEECLEATLKIPDQLQKKDYQNRQDIRHLPLVTIDGETAKDFDDAVYAEKIGRNYRLIVAIADVSHYVTPDSALDKNAFERGTSVYFPRRVIPMLPEKLSNGLCSLNPHVDRLCMVCEIHLTYAGNIKSYQFYPAVMQSHARLTYTQVWDWIQSNSDHKYKKQIDTLYGLFKVLYKKRIQRGALEFDSKETQMIFNDNGKIENIIPIERNDAHRLIEECMLLANVCAANLMTQKQHTGLYRVHDKPSLEKLNILHEQLQLLGLQLSGKNQPEPKDYANLLEHIQNRSDKSLIGTMLLRSMLQASYQTKNLGHFGLAYEAYSHFTSPIRRYPDLIVHRVIKAILNKKQYQPKQDWAELAIHCSHTERRADEAAKDVEKWLKTFYMRDKIGEIFDGIISGMSNFGLFVTLNNIAIEGMIHVSDLGQDYFIYRPEILSIEGERTKTRFNMGDKVVVKVIRADLDTSRIDFALIAGGIANKKSKSSANTKIQKTNPHKTKKHKTKNTKQGKK